MTSSGRLTSSREIQVGSGIDGTPAVSIARLITSFRHDDRGNGSSSVDADRVCLFVCHIGIGEVGRLGAPNGVL